MLFSITTCSVDKAFLIFFVFLTKFLKWPFTFTVFLKIIKQKNKSNVAKNVILILFCFWVCFLFFSQVVVVVSIRFMCEFLKFLNERFNAILCQ